MNSTARYYNLQPNIYNLKTQVGKYNAILHEVKNKKEFIPHVFTVFQQPCSLRDVHIIAFCIFWNALGINIYDSLTNIPLFISQN